MKKESVLSARNLNIGYRDDGDEKIVHKGLDITLYAGELTCLLGANGAGKSTLLRTLSAAQKPLAGKVLLGDTTLDKIDRRKLSQTIGVVLTDKTSVGGLTVFEVAALGRHPHTGFFGKLSPHDTQVVYQALDACGIADMASRYMASLSDGEKQKVLIAKVLAQECPIVILDEPTAFLDVISRIEIMSLLNNLATEYKRAILLSTHDIEQALTLGDRLWLLSKEKGLVSGVTEDLILSGSLDNLFPNKNICFDPSLGSYYPLVQSHRNIIVQCDDEMLSHWAINFLNRNGYTASINKTTDKETPVLNIGSRNTITYSTTDKSYTVNSFEELTKIIFRQH